MPHACVWTKGAQPVPRHQQLVQDFNNAGATFLTRLSPVTTIAKSLWALAVSVGALTLAAPAQADAATAPDAAPSHFTVTRILPDAVDLHFTDSSTDETAFRLAIQKSPSGSWKRFKTWSGSDPSSATGKYYFMRLKGLRDGRVLCYRVSALNATGTTSSPVRCDAPAKPTPPTDFGLKYTYDTSAIFDFRKSQKWGWGYRMYTRRAGGHPWVLNGEPTPQGLAGHRTIWALKSEARAVLLLSSDCFQLGRRIGAD